jgi:hypothetical protein
MTNFIFLVIGWILGVFTHHALEPVARLIGTIWHRASRRTLPEQDATSYAIHKALKIHQVRRFFKIPSPPD